MSFCQTPTTHDAYVRTLLMSLPVLIVGSSSGTLGPHSPSVYYTTYYMSMNTCWKTGWTDGYITELVPLEEEKTLLQWYNLCLKHWFKKKNRLELLSQSVYQLKGGFFIFISSFWNLLLLFSKKKHMGRIVTQLYEQAAHRLLTLKDWEWHKTYVPSKYHK